MNYLLMNVAQKYIAVWLAICELNIQNSQSENAHSFPPSFKFAIVAGAVHLEGVASERVLADGPHLPRHSRLQEGQMVRERSCVLVVDLTLWRHMFGHSWFIWLLEYLSGPPHSHCASSCSPSRTCSRLPSRRIPWYGSRTLIDGSINPGSVNRRDRMLSFLSKLTYKPVDLYSDRYRTLA